MKTYQDVIDQIESSDCRLHVAISYASGTIDWLPVDKVAYVHQLRLIDFPQNYKFPCWFEIEKDGDMYIHPKCENQAVPVTPECPKCGKSDSMIYSYVHNEWVCHHTHVV
jgi:hypothetical protein